MNFRAAITFAALVGACAAPQLDVREGWPPLHLSECHKIFARDSLPSWIVERLEHFEKSGVLKEKIKRKFEELKFKGSPQFTFAVNCDSLFLCRYFWQSKDDPIYAGVQAWIVFGPKGSGKTKIYMERIPYE